MLKTFSIGGIHPPENKLSATSSIKTLPLPSEVILPVSQHIGAPSVPVVAKGDKVLVGQLIAKSSGFVSSNIYSSVSGVVTKIDNTVDSSGYARNAIFIEVQGDEWMPTIDRSQTIVKECNLSASEIIEKVSESGIVGLGGATFPTHIKLSPPPGKTVQVLVVNGVECEPYLTSDHRLMLEKGAEILVGITILMKALGVSRAVVGIENNKKDAIATMQHLSAQFAGIEIAPLKVKYPQGGEKQLVKAAINREIPSGMLPIEVGAIVINVGTAFATYEAVQKNKPLFERVITVSGKSVKNPSNFLVRLGTPIANLIEAAGGIPEDVVKIIGGGPMMGKALTNSNISVTKGSSGVLFLQREETLRKPMQNCIRCAKCVSVCPMGLSPYLLMTAGHKALHDLAESELITDCVECGSCSFTCPANRPLLDYIRLEKGLVTGFIRNRSKK